MDYTEYKLPADWVAAEVAAKRESIRKNLGESADLLKNGVAVIANRLEKDPLRYRDYGPYWWAVKVMLRGGGVSLGSNDDPLMREAYSGDKPIETLVMAEAFRDMYLATYLRYSNQFVLDGESLETVEIVDGDMEQR